MEIPSVQLMSELEMLDSTFINQYPTNPLDNYYSLYDPLNIQSLCPQTYYPNIEDSHVGFERSLKQLQTTTSRNSSIIDQHIPPSTSHFISYKNSNSDSPPAISHRIYGLMNPMISHRLYDHHQETKKIGNSVTRSPSHAQDHVIAERKRREKLGERFVALSTLLPGLKKTDKASILGDAINYLKQLQERVKTLEEQATKKTMESSMIIVKKYQICTNAETFSSDENIDRKFNQYLPEIEAKVVERDVLIRIHCKKKKGCVVNILNQIEKLHLTVIRSNLLPFANSTLEITIVARMEVEFGMTVKDFVKNLRLALGQFL